MGKTTVLSAGVGVAVGVPPAAVVGVDTPEGVAVAADGVVAAGVPLLVAVRVGLGVAVRVLVGDGVRVGDATLVAVAVAVGVAVGTMSLRRAMMRVLPEHPMTGSWKLTSAPFPPQRGSESDVPKRLKSGSIGSEPA